VGTGPSGRTPSGSLPPAYFHVVFTLPEEIATIAYQNKAVVYNLLFAATAETLLTIVADPKRLGAQLGFFAVLHTWGQTLVHHPHLHCVVPGGGLSAAGERWVACRRGFFLPVRVLSRFFRRCFLRLLEKAFDRVSTLDDAVAAFNPTERRKGKTIIRVRPLQHLLPIDESQPSAK
jgi:Putative transposase